LLGAHFSLKLCLCFDRFFHPLLHYWSPPMPPLSLLQRITKNAAFSHRRIFIPGLSHAPSQIFPFLCNIRFFSVPPLYPPFFFLLHALVQRVFSPNIYSQCLPESLFGVLLPFFCPKLVGSGVKTVRGVPRAVSWWFTFFLSFFNPFDLIYGRYLVRFCGGCFEFSRFQTSFFLE